MANTKRDATKEAFWRDAIGRQAQSGLSVREFCRRHGLSESSFHERRRTYQQRDAQRSAAPPAFVPVIVRDEQPTESTTDAGLVIELRGGRRLRLPGSMPASRVAELVRALEAAEGTA
jgi:transposase